jgi:hypothetical protein
MVITGDAGYSPAKERSKTEKNIAPLKEVY